ncbi:MAG: folate-binding protein YgfZ [Gammaproteobacteria bacterium]|nr:folate-binding protein YgfZ [Gammaproteobacteria bacterium]MDE2345691.1 folate-binding protein YgfZ [Gammaproteobacteria bacterium]
MHPTWLEFLKLQGANFAGGYVTDFGQPGTELSALIHGAILADLSQLGMIRATGQDNRDFLHGQLSTNVLTLRPHESQLTTWNSAKGRVVSILRLFQDDGAMLLTLPRALTQPVLQRLSRYVLRSSVSLTDASDEVARFGIAGQAAPSLLASCFGAVPGSANAVATDAAMQIVRLHGDVPRFVIQGEPARLISLWSALAQNNAVPMGAAAWTLLRIQAREPVVHPETSEHFVAQMLGLEELGAIDFNKGCYIGQEIIARAHYRGAVKRHLHRASCKPATTVQPGTMLFASGSENQAGEVVDAATDALGVTQMLVVIQDDSRDAQLSLADGGPVKLQD